jgi:hypothetical protein
MSLTPSKIPNKACKEASHQLKANRAYQIQKSLILHTQKAHTNINDCHKTRLNPHRNPFY